MKPILLLRSLFLGTLLVHASDAFGGLSAPDTVLYGALVINGQALTTNDPPTFVEARLTPGGPALARYQLGADSALGNNYLLAIPLEEMRPASGTNVATVGNILFIVVRDANGDRAQTTLTLTERGLVQRLDFNSGSSNGVPGDPFDDWQIAHYGRTGINTNAIAANGQSIWANYIAGTDPNDPNSRFALSVSLLGDRPTISFLGLGAHGLGYEGVSRYYAIEFTTNLESGWFGLSPFTNILGTDQVVTITGTSSHPTAIYRARVWLTTP